MSALVRPRRAGGGGSSGLGEKDHRLHADADDDSAVYFQWRRRLEEECFLFNVPRDNRHRCDEEEGRAIVALDGARRRGFGCSTCGRYHRCSADAERCPLSRAPDGEHYVCLFSGRVLTHHEEAVPGSHTIEMLQRDPARLTASELPWAHTTSARSHQQRGNAFASGSVRKAEFAKRDAARELRQGLYSARAVEADAKRAERLAHEAVHGRSSAASSKKRKRTDESNGGGRGGSRKRQRVRNSLDTAASGSGGGGGGGGTGWEPDGDDDHAVEPDLGAVRPTVFPADETLRDAAFPDAYFAPLASVWSEIAAEGERRSHEKNNASEDPRWQPLQQPAQQQQQHRRPHTAIDRESLQTLQRLVRQLVGALDSVHGCRDGRSIGARADGFATLIGNVLPLLLAPVKFDETRASVVGDLSVHVVAFLANLLSTDERANDSYGNLLVVWRADPWLAECSAHGIFEELARRLRDLTAPPARHSEQQQQQPPSPRPPPTVVVAPRTVGFRIQASGLVESLVGGSPAHRKRGRKQRPPLSSSSSLHPHADSPLTNLPPDLCAALLASPRITRQLATRMRASLGALRLSPLALYSLVHTGQAL